jgi:hypothetical protein
MQFSHQYQKYSRLRHIALVSIKQPFAAGSAGVRGDALKLSRSAGMSERVCHPQPWHDVADIAAPPRRKFHSR